MEKSEKMTAVQVFTELTKKKAEQEKKGSMKYEHNLKK